MTLNDSFKDRLAVIDARLEPFIKGDVHGSKVDPLATALHELVWVVRDLSDEVHRARLNRQ